MNVEDALRKRRSIRAFRPDAIPFATVREILEIASRAPSSTNIQPWNVHVVTGEARRELVEAILAHRENSPSDASAEFVMADWRRDPFLARMKKLGKDMYGLLEIPKGDQQAMWDQWGRNYKFFDAPVGMIFSMDKDLDFMNYIDLGILMQSIALVAESRGLGVCMHGAWHDFWTVTKRVLDIPESQYVVVGMSLGYVDDTAPVNRLVTEREPVENFVRFHGFSQ